MEDGGGGINTEHMSRTVGGGKMEDGGGINTEHMSRTVGGGKMEDTEHMSWLAYNNISITAQSIIA